MKKNLSKWSLQLFAEEVSVQTVQTDSGDDNNGQTVAAAQPTQNTEGATSANAVPTPEAKFRELIKGEYKQQFADEIQKIINQRFKNQKVLEAQVEKMQRINSVLGVKYGIDANDSDAILAAVEGDESVYEEAAYKAGMNVDVFKEHLKGQEALRQLQEQGKQERRQQVVRILNTQAEGVKAKFGDATFDWQSEYATNAKFKGFIDSGASVEEAYVALNFEKINAQNIAKAAEQAKSAVASDIIANGYRPVEGSVQGQAPIKTSINPLSLSDAQFDEIMEKVRRGEHVYF